MDIGKKLSDMTAEDLKVLIRTGHPTEHGIDISRGDVIEEITKRGTKLLTELGYDINGWIRNRYTDHEVPLQDELKIFIDLEHRPDETIDHYVFGVIENWEPMPPSSSKEQELKKLAGKNKSLMLMSHMSQSLTSTVM